MNDQTKPEYTPELLVERLVTLLDVEQLDVDLYRGPRQPGGQGRVFGGQVIAQALMGAHRSTGEGKVAHSLHAYFMRPGDEDFPIIYRVVRDFDGRSFATRRVIATQGGQPILSLTASFQRPEEGLAHHLPMPDVPGPEALEDERDLFRREWERTEDPRLRFAKRRRPIEIRPVQPRFTSPPRKREPAYQCWFRAAAPLPDDPALHQAVLAYASDMALLGTAMLPHGVSWWTNKMQNASLDHVVWLHEPFRADEWLLYAMDSPWAGGARGFNRGAIYARDGRLVASVAQEGLIRLKE